MEAESKTSSSSSGGFVPPTGADTILQEQIESFQEQGGGARNENHVTPRLLSERRKS